MPRRDELTYDLGPSPSRRSIPWPSVLLLVTVLALTIVLAAALGRLLTFSSRCWKQLRDHPNFNRGPRATDASNGGCSMSTAGAPRVLKTCNFPAIPGRELRASASSSLSGYHLMAR